VGVDHPRAKNLIGAFYQPRLIVADLTALNTLPDVEFRCGLAEVVKAGVIGSPALFAHLEREGPTPLSWVIEESIAVKVRVVEEDPFEQGRRAVLNLGHTFAHAFEALSHYTLRHGEAVSMGMVVAARVAVELGLCEEAVERRLVGLLAELGLPVAWEGFEPEQVWEAMALDKKKQGKALRFILPKGIGEVIVTNTVPKGVILQALEKTHG